MIRSFFFFFFIFSSSASGARYSRVGSRHPIRRRCRLRQLTVILRSRRGLKKQLATHPARRGANLCLEHAHSVTSYACRKITRKKKDLIYFVKKTGQNLGIRTFFKVYSSEVGAADWSQQTLFLPTLVSTILIFKNMLRISLLFVITLPKLRLKTYFSWM